MQQFLVDPVEFLLQLHHVMLYGGQQVLGLLPIAAAGHGNQAPDFRHPYPEKFVQVIGENTQVAQAGNQGPALVGGLL